MTPTRVFVCLLSFLCLTACDLDSETFKFADRSLKISNKHIRSDLMSAPDLPGFDKNGGTVWVKIAPKEVIDKSGKRLLDGFYTLSEFHFELTPSNELNFKYKPRARGQDTKEYQENVDGGEDIVFDVKDVGKIGDNMRPTLILDAAKNIQSMCHFGYEPDKSIDCHNYIEEGKVMIEYDISHTFMLDPNRKKALDEFLKNQVRQWTVKP